MIEQINAAIAKLLKRKATLSQVKLTAIETEEAGTIEVDDNGNTTAKDGVYTIKDSNGVQIEVKGGIAQIVEPATAEEIAEEISEEKAEVKQDAIPAPTMDTPATPEAKVAELETKIADLQKELEAEKAKNTQLTADKTKVEEKLSAVEKQPATGRLVMSQVENTTLTEKQIRIQARLAQHKASLK